MSIRANDLRNAMAPSARKKAFSRVKSESQSGVSRKSLGGSQKRLQNAVVSPKWKWAQS